MPPSTPDADPAQVEVTENLWIPLADGTPPRGPPLAAGRRPAAPFPRVLEYIPYRKRDGTRGPRRADAWLVRRPTAMPPIRVDMRGSGESDGCMDDEYLKQEQDDALEVIAWIAAQPWCSGARRHDGQVLGRLQRAAGRGPPPAGAEGDHHRLLDRRPLCRRHPLHGRLPAQRQSLVGRDHARLPGAAAAIPTIVGEGWREAWQARLAHMPFWPGALARRTSAATTIGGTARSARTVAAIHCPVLAVGGWADAYTNAVPRLLEGLDVPRQGIIGPWAHLYPQDGVPGPAIGFLQEAKRWWDHWLKGEDTRHHGRADAARLHRG